MSVHAVKLPDVGEGIAEAELVEWLVDVGDEVAAEAPLAEVLTDKATVEISAPVSGVVAFRHGQPGEMIAVGTEFVGIETGTTVEAAPVEAIHPSIEPSESIAPLIAPSIEPAIAPSEPADRTGRSTASPAVRQRARSLGIDLAATQGSGPGGRIVHADLDRVLTAGGDRQHTLPVANGSSIEPVRGLRRRIAERLTRAWTEIPHITYVEEIDATELEVLRASLNQRASSGAARLTVLPFLAKALVIACGEQPRLNAHYDAEQATLEVFEAMHIGIATQTPGGLLVPVLRDAGSLRLTELATEISRLATAARDGSATARELTGSTITISSLGALGGVMTTPIINPPEVAIVGVNKIAIRPVWSDGAFVPRSMFNLSSSFDHRIVDGWDAATFIQRVKDLIETPALLFIEGHDG